MSTEKKLIEMVRSFHFNDSDIDQNLKTFFNLLLTSWEILNIDAIMSNISIDNMEDTAIFFNELFDNLPEFASKSATNINANNVIILMNTLDTFLPQILISKSEQSSNVLNEYNCIKERSFLKCFEKVKRCLHRQSNETHLIEIKNIFLILTRVSRIRYYEYYVYKFASFLWEMFDTYKNKKEIKEVLLFSLSNISDQLAKFLIWKTDAKNNESFKSLALEIFRTLKNDLIEMKFITSEIPYILNILDHHDRFIGQFVDAVPENILEDGYVICSSMTQPLEADDVYEDYEQFSALENQ